jgi:membrane-associated phospholipid phosphatase
LNSGRSGALGTGREPGWFDRHWVLAGAGLLALGIALDRPADRYAQDHGANPSMKALRKAGDALPTLALGLAGTHWLFERGSPAGDTALAATSAGLGAYAGSKLLKSAISRDRPIEGLGPNSFGQSGAARGDSSLPSNHAAIAWAVLTPYAQTYGQDWLYGLAGLTSFGRVMGREHWASDAIAGSLIGYHLGSWARTRLGNGASLSLVGRGVALSMPLP